MTGMEAILIGHVIGTALGIPLGFELGQIVEEESWNRSTPGKPESIEEYTARRKAADEARFRAYLERQNESLEKQ